MNLAEFKSKWCTDRTIEVPLTICSGGASNTVKMSVNVYNAPLGDFLDEYLLHIKAPRWRRDSDWAYVKTSMKRILNNVRLEWVS